jgi:hypothetical protein
MAKKRSKGRKGHKGFRIWHAMLITAVICYVVALIFYLEMMYAIQTYSIDVDESDLLGGLFGSIFGMIGAVTGIAGVYAQYVSVFLWLGIGFTAATIVFAILESKKIL